MQLMNDAPMTAENFPGPQSLQEVKDVDLGSVEYLPAGQAKQDTLEFPPR